MKTLTINKLIIIIFSLNLLFLNSVVIALENKIIFKVDEEIITSLDITNEIKYLNILNPKMGELDEKTLVKIAKNSIIREKIKKIEINKINKDSKVNDLYLNQLLEKIYLNINLKSINEFDKFLSNNDLDIEFVKDKISIEALWNELIFYKFSTKVKIDENNLKKKILKNKDRTIKSYDLSEIVFNVSEKKELENKYIIIKNDIETKGFSSAALINSISETSNTGGDLGWVSEKSMSNIIIEEIILINVGEYTRPIIIPGGALILKLNSVKKDKIELDLEKELENLIKNEKNRQLNQLSIVYFNKVKKDIEINEL